MLISYPILRQDNIHDDEDIYLANVIESALVNTEGRYPISTLTTPQGQVHRWHGGVHLYGGGEPLRAIADGTVVACRFTAARETYEGLGDYDTSFVLLRHETQSGENTTVVFYSLYMHLANQADLAADRLSQLPTWFRNNPGTDVKRPANQRVWRKDVLGFAGQLYGRETCHFEVFMLDADFNRVWHDSGAIAQGTGSDDWFGDAHFVVPAQRDFAASHPRATTQGILIQDAPGTQHDVYFPTPPGVTGRNDEKLYVSVSLHQGRRIATTYREAATGGYEQVGHPVVQDNYEYELYRLSTALYPDCPSAGLEWLRFGRVLGSDTTTRNENWQLVRYSNSAVGYIDLAPNEIVKLSDADFPHWQGWKRSDEGATVSAADGLCDDADVIALARATGEDAERRLRHMICKAPTEWDDSDLSTRYARMREDGQPLQSDESWGKFQEHVSKMAFWTGAGMTDRSVWHFHPLQFIRHYKMCGWISNNEMAQCFPRELKHLTGRQFVTHTFPWNDALSRSETWGGHFNRANRKYGIDRRKRLIHYFAQVIPETGYLRLMKEGDSKDGKYLKSKPYYPFYGRGLIQLTWGETYKKYGKYRGFPQSEGATSRFSEAGWNPDDLLVSSNTNYNPANCADSAGYYIASYRGMIRKMDSGISVDDCVAVCRCVNGNVALQNINGLDERLQSVLFIRDVLLDFPADSPSENLHFTWRRSSEQELTGNLNKKGQPIKAYIATDWDISVSLMKQRPR